MEVKNAYLICGNSVKVINDSVQAIDLHAFSAWGTAQRMQVLNFTQVAAFEAFIKEKIDNGTLYTPPDMENYSKVKRLQLFVNSNIAEHAIIDVLGGELLDGNDILTINSKAVLGPDRCALADATIDGISTEVKVTLNDSSRNLIFTRAHKKPVVAAYTISPNEGYHWMFYVRGDKGDYAPVDFVVNNQYMTYDGRETFDPKIADKAFAWQKSMNTEAKVLQLLHFKELENKTVEITTMTQKAVR